jgi:RNA polymerase sigma-70 factor (ECF subfamily)
MTGGRAHGAGSTARGGCRRPGRALDAGADEGRVRGLVAAARAGDRDAMDELYIRYRRTVEGYVGAIVGDRHDAEDVTQQVFAKLMTDLGRYEPQSAAFVGWLLRVARNAAIDHRRRTRAVPSAEVRDALAHVDDAGDRCRASLCEVLAALPPGQRDVLVLRHLVGLSPGEIAVRTGRSVGAVRGLHHRGRLAARAALDDLGCAPATTC